MNRFDENYDETFDFTQMYEEILSSDGSEDEVIFQIERLRYNAAIILRNEGQRLTKRVIHRNREEGHARLWKEYFAEDCIYPDKDFRRRFRMTRALFNRVLEGVIEVDDYFVQKRDATGRLGLSSHQKMVAALRMLAFGVSADIWGEYTVMGESTVLETVERFCLAVMTKFSQKYLRKPTKNDVKRLYEENAARGFPGMLGSIDCMHWRWKNCPTAWHGQYRGHKGAPTIILEVVASYDTWIWNAFFGMPGSCNDINVLHRSTVFHDLLNGTAPNMPYTINNRSYKHGYFLADGIYPPYATIVQAVRAPTTPKQRHFKAAQESVRKDVERAFGILQARWGFIREPTRLWDKDKINMVVKTCIVLHNMIVDDERRCEDWDYEYEQYVEQCEQLTEACFARTSGESSSGSQSLQPEELLLLPRDPARVFHNMLDRDRELRDREVHHRLQNDLIEHLWERYSNNVE